MSHTTRILSLRFEMILAPLTKCRSGHTWQLTIGSGHNWSLHLVEVRHPDPALPVLVLGVLLEQVHDLVVELLGGLLVADGPVVDVPVVGGKVDQPVVQGQLLVVKVRRYFLAKLPRRSPFSSIP